MSVAGTLIDDLTNEHLSNFVKNEVPEGLLLDYKRDLYGESGEDKKELLRDVSAFANASGGAIIIGIDEKNGIPIGLSPISDIDPDKELLRIEGIIRTGIEPRLVGLRTRAIAAEGGYVFVVEVSKSWNPPHRVAHGGHNKFYVRNSNGKHEADVTELRVLFTNTASTTDRLASHFGERVSRISLNDGVMPLQSPSENRRGKLIVQIAPIGWSNATFGMDLQAVKQHEFLFRSIKATGTSGRVNLDGYCIHEFSSETGRAKGYTQVFRTGIVEAVTTGFITNLGGGDRFKLPSTWIDQSLVESTMRFIQGLQKIGGEAPYVISIGFEGTKDTTLAVRDEIFDPGEVFGNNEIKLPLIFCASPPSNVLDAAEILRPAIVALWNAYGFENSDNYDASGKWAPQR